MKHRTIILVLVLNLVGTPDCRADRFVNLDFEGANTNSITLQSVSPLNGFPDRFVGPTIDLLPGWRLSVNGYPIDSIGFNGGIGGPGQVVLWERPVLEQWYGPHLIAQFPVADGGKYVLGLLHSGWPSYELTQRGDIPAGAHLLQIHGGNLGTDGFFTAFIDGTRVVDGDIAKFAGKNVELQIASKWVTPTPPSVGAGTPLAIIDSISFTTPKEPEPIRLKIERFGQTIVISWNGGGTLTSSSTINGEFTPMIKGKTTPYFLGLDETIMFYRVESQEGD